MRQTTQFSSVQFIAKCISCAMRQSQMMATIALKRDGKYIEAIYSLYLCVFVSVVVCFINKRQVAGMLFAAYMIH